VIDRISGEDKLFIAIQAGHIAFDKVNDIARAKKYFSIAASIEPSPTPPSLGPGSSAPPSPPDDRRSISIPKWASAG
jgi:hypothetical protein